MRKATRRDFVKGCMAAGLALGLPRAAGSTGANSDVRLAIVGLGGIDVPGGVGGRGRQLIDAFSKVRGARVTALCDVDTAILDHGVQMMKKMGVEVTTCTDLRRVARRQERGCGGGGHAQPLACAGGGLGVSGRQGRLRRETVRVQHLGRAADRRCGPEVRADRAGGNAEPVQRRAAPGRGVHPQRRTGQASLCSRRDLPAASEHWQGGGADAGSEHRGLRPLERAGPHRARSPKEPAL